LRNLKDIVLKNLRDLIRPPPEVPDRYIPISVFLVLGLLAPLLNLYWLQTLIYGMLMGMIALSNDLLNGYSGVLSITPLAFWAIGGFAAALLSGSYHPYIAGGGDLIGMQINPWLTIVLAGLVTASVGIAISFPSLRLKGVYTAFLLIVFNEILRRAIVNEEWLTGGQIGLQLRYKLTWIPDTRIAYYYVILAFLVLSFVFMRKVVSSRVGLALRALGDNELAAKQSGVSIVKYRVIAFFVASFFIGVAGALYAYTFLYINEGMADLSHSFLVIVMSILGGVATLSGPMVGALIYIVISEWLRFLDVWRYVIFGFLLIVVVLFLPKGIVGTALHYVKRRKSS
jgi:ABC-type branched-subunit amino acid transport system permease subunit